MIKSVLLKAVVPIKFNSVLQKSYCKALFKLGMHRDIFFYRSCLQVNFPWRVLRMAPGVQLINRSRREFSHRIAKVGAEISKAMTSTLLEENFALFDMKTCDSMSCEARLCRRTRKFKSLFQQMCICKWHQLFYSIHKVWPPQENHTFLDFFSHFPFSHISFCTASFFIFN